MGPLTFYGIEDRWRGADQAQMDRLIRVLLDVAGAQDREGAAIRPVKELGALFQVS